MAEKTENWTTDREAWEKHGISLLRKDSDGSWDVAEWIHAGAHSHRLSPAWIAEHYGLSKSICHRYNRVVQMFPRSDRFAGLSFSHHLAVIRLEREAAMTLLAGAESNRESCETLRKTAKKMTDDAEIRRLKKENNALKKRLQTANEKLAAETVERVTGRLGEALRTSNRGYRQAADVIEELSESGLLDYVHGNARRGAIRKLEGLTNTAGRKNEAAISRINTAIESLRGENR